MLPAAGFSLIINIRTHGFKQGPAGLEIIFVSANQDRQGTVNGTRVSAGNRRVDDMKSPLLPLGIYPFGQSRARRHVDEIRPRRGAVKNITCAEIDFLYVLGKADHRNDGVAALHALADSRAEYSPFGDEIRRLCFHPGKHPQGKSPLHQVPGHGLAHNPYANKSYRLHHLSLLSIKIVLLYPIWRVLLYNCTHFPRQNRSEGRTESPAASRLYYNKVLYFIRHRYLMPPSLTEDIPEADCRKNRR